MPPVHKADIVIYGGTSAAITAAVQATKMGRSVRIVCPESHLGGMTTGGLGYTDAGRTDAIGGLALEFYQRVYREYEKPATWKWEKRDAFSAAGQATPAMELRRKAAWLFEPSVAECVYLDWLAEYGIAVDHGQYLDRDAGVTKDAAGRITEIRMLSGAAYRAQAYIDVTYEGDLMAAAGVSTFVGREACSVYGEEWNGVQPGATHHRHYFAKPIDPYRIPGDPGSGLLPHISSHRLAPRGTGDAMVQAYNFRMCMTSHAPNRVPFPKPDVYNADDYELLLRIYASGWNETFEKFDYIPNYKTDTNNHGPFSSDFIGANHRYPTASYAERAQIVTAHIRYHQGLLYFMSNDPRMPQDRRDAMRQWGLAADEFPDNGHWPYQIYVREARRLVGAQVMTEHEVLGRRPIETSVGMGSYGLDSHNVIRYVDDHGHVQNEGDIGIHPKQPYAIYFEAIVPKKAECTNLAVPVCCSASHSAFGSIRMEPVFMVLGQSAATALIMALENRSAVQDLPYAELEQRLRADGQILQNGQ